MHTDEYKAQQWRRAREAAEKQAEVLKAKRKAAIIAQLARNSEIRSREMIAQKQEQS